jgi:uncharacterized protein (TIGR03086 family)
VIALTPACDVMLALLAEVADGQLANSSPCAEYRVAHLVDHIDQVSQLFTVVACGGVTEPFAGRPVTARLALNWRGIVGEHVQELGKAWGYPGPWTGSTSIFGLDLPNETWGKIALTELVIHAWDIAKATDRSLDLPEPTAQAVFDHVAAFVPTAPVPGLFGPPVEVPPNAVLLDRIVAITGRTP